MRYKNFTSWPLNQYTNDGVNVVVSPQDMTTEVNTKIQDKQVFRFGGLFADDCRFGCGDMPSKLAANGKGKILDTLTSGLNAWSQSQKAQAEREAINAPIQGSAADLIKIAMINTHHEIQRRNLKSKMILQVHDELVFDAHMDELDELKALVIDSMQNAMHLNVPIIAEVGIGDNWLQAH